jgi:hypothetical protein
MLNVPVEWWNVGMMAKEHSKESYRLIYAPHPLFQTSSIPIFIFYSDTSFRNSLRVIILNKG